MACRRFQTTTYHWLNTVSCRRSGPPYSYRATAGYPPSELVVQEPSATAKPSDELATCPPYGDSVQSYRSMLIEEGYSRSLPRSMSDHFSTHSNCLGGVQIRRGYATKTITGVTKTNNLVQRLSVPWDPSVPLPVLPKYIGNDLVSERIIYIWERFRQTRKEYSDKVYIRSMLQQSVFPDFILTIVGSSASGFGFIESDVDMCMSREEGSFPLSNDMRSQLFVLKKRLNGITNVTGLHVINAIVPLIKFSFKRPSSTITVDLNMANTVGIRNTQLLFAYSRMDCRVAPLVLAAKRWASEMCIKDAQRGTMSSYTITLLVIFFLQLQGVVPVLQNEVPEFANGRGFPKGKPLLLPRWQSQNKMTVGELFKAMLDYYSTFDFEAQCVSVRDGRTLTKEEAMDLDPKISIPNGRMRNSETIHWWKFIMVQEPFNYTNVARAVFEKRRFDEIKDAFQRSREIMEMDHGPKVLLA